MHYYPPFKNAGQVQWFILVIPVLWEVEECRITRAQEFETSLATWRNPSLQQIQKVASHGGLCL